MFEEAQLYSPVTQAEDGSVQVHLADDHPGKTDPEYQRRRNEIASAALGKPSTDELAVMVDTFAPLDLAAACDDIDDPNYPWTWARA